MTQAEQKYFETYLDLFTSDGWKQFLNELAGRQSMYDLGKINDLKDLFFVKGELSVINMVLNFETMIRNAQEQAENGDEEEDGVEPETNV